MFHHVYIIEVCLHLFHKRIQFGRIFSPCVDYAGLLELVHDCTTSPSAPLRGALSYIIPIITCWEGEFRKRNFILNVELKYER